MKRLQRMNDDQLLVWFGRHAVYCHNSPKKPYSVRIPGASRALFSSDTSDLFKQLKKAVHG